jgi:mycothiol synthase
MENAVQRFAAGLSTSGATMDDVAEVTELLQASEGFDHGELDVTIEDVLSDWSRPQFHPASDVLLVREGTALLAYAEVPGWRAEATVHPSARGRGIGTALLAWIEHRALTRPPAHAERRVGQTVKDSNSGAITLFVRQGYEIRHTSWVLRLPDDVTIEDVRLPDDVSIRPYRQGIEDRPVYQVIEDAFNEWSTRQATRYESWRAASVERLDFDPELLLVAVKGEEILGASLCLPYPEEGWVEQLAVRGDHRGRGIAKALLRRSFEDMRALGLPAVGVSTDSRTGALGLYASVGMELRSTYLHYSKLLTRS